MSRREKMGDRFRALTDCQKTESRLIGELGKLLDQPSTALTRQTLLAILNRLLDNLRLHLELASYGGYLTEVRRLRPNWQQQVKELLGANVRCLATLHELCDHIRHESPPGTIDTTESGEIEIWIRSLKSIREHECRLLQGAFTIDVGGEA